MSESYYLHKPTHNVTIHNTHISTTKSIETQVPQPSTITFMIPTYNSEFINSPPMMSPEPSSQESDELGFVAPLIGVISGLGLLAFIALYCIQQINKPKLVKKTSSSTLGPDEAPPVYTPVAIPTPVKEKRLTADTLVDFSMLKSQYSPQLAFSPSLVAGELKQDHTQLPQLPSMLSPSNTLINSSSCLFSSSLDKSRSKFDTYEPQLLNDDDYH